MYRLEMKITDEEMNTVSHIEVESEYSKNLTAVFNRAMIDIADSIPDSTLKTWDDGDRICVGTESCYFSFPVSAIENK